MSKIFLNTILQHGGTLTNSEKVTILNDVSKHINKKIKILEYTYGIKIKLEPLSTDNYDSLPKNISIATVAKIDGPVRGEIPIVTSAQISLPTPTISQVTTGIPLTPYGPILGVPAIGINPFGNTSSLDEKNKKAIKYIEILRSIKSQLENPLLDKEKLDKTYFDFVDLEPDEIDEILDKTYSGYSSL